MAEKTPSPKRAPRKRPAPKSDLLAEIRGKVGKISKPPPANEHTGHMIQVAQFVYNGFMQIMELSVQIHGASACAIKGRLLATELLQLMEDFNAAKISKAAAREVSFHAGQVFLKLDAERDATLRDRKKQSRKQKKT